jgi:hypothetical protein
VGRRAFLVSLIVVPLGILAFVLGGWVGVILAGMALALVAATVLDHR